MEKHHGKKTEGARSQRQPAFGPETKSSSSSPRSAMTSTVRASPVDCRPMTTHLPSASASLEMRTKPGTCAGRGAGVSERWLSTHLEGET